MIRVFWFVVLVSSPFWATHIYHRGIDDVANAAYYIVGSVIVLLVMLIPFLKIFIASSDEINAIRHEKAEEDKKYWEALRRQEAIERDYRKRLAEVYAPKTDIESILNNDDGEWVNTDYGLLPIEITEEQYKKLALNRLGQKDLYEMAFIQDGESVIYIYRLKKEKKEKPILENVIEFEL